jgi:hypothetical protein
MQQTLKHGQFTAVFKTDKDSYTQTVSPLTQEDIAEGWRLVLPQRGNTATVHHFSVYLSQLPFHLWRDLKTNWNDEKQDHYLPINDGIYQYSVKTSPHDKDIKRLYRLSFNYHRNKDEIIRLYNHLEEQRVKGWLMIHVKNIITA